MFWIMQSELDRGEIRELSTSFSIPPRSVDLCMLRSVPPSAATQRFAQDLLKKMQAAPLSD